MTRDVLLRVLALADDRRREDGVGRGDGRGEDERREELEARDDGVHERAGRHPAEEHAAERTDRVVSMEAISGLQGRGRHAHWPEEHCQASPMPPDVGSASETPPSVWLHGEQESRPESALGQFDANRKDG